MFQPDTRLTPPPPPPPPTPPPPSSPSRFSVFLCVASPSLHVDGLPIECHPGCEGGDSSGAECQQLQRPLRVLHTHVLWGHHSPQQRVQINLSQQRWREKICRPLAPCVLGRTVVVGVFRVINRHVCRLLIDMCRLLISINRHVCRLLTGSVYGWGYW